MPKMDDADSSRRSIAVIEDEIRNDRKLAYPSSGVVNYMPLWHLSEIERTRDQSVPHPFGRFRIVLRNKFNNLPQVGQRTVGD